MPSSVDLLSPGASNDFPGIPEPLLSTGDHIERLGSHCDLRDSDEVLANPANLETNLESLQSCGPELFRTESCWASRQDRAFPVTCGT
jgi:hypothetical protein